MLVTVIIRGRMQETMMAVIERYLGRLYTWYGQRATMWPFTTAFLTGMSIVSASDVTAQVLERRPALDKKRLAAMALYGGLYSGIGHRVLYATLERAVPASLGLWRRTAVQVSISQFLHTPFMQLPIFYISTGLIQGRTVEQISALMRDTYGYTLWHNYAFWLPTTTALYAVVPLHFRTLAMNVASFAWNTFLSSTQRPALCGTAP